MAIKLFEELAPALGGLEVFERVNKFLKVINENKKNINFLLKNNKKVKNWNQKLKVLEMLANVTRLKVFDFENSFTDNYFNYIEENFDWFFEDVEGVDYDSFDSDRDLEIVEKILDKNFTKVEKVKGFKETFEDDDFDNLGLKITVFNNILFNKVIDLKSKILKNNKEKDKTELFFTKNILDNLGLIIDTFEDSLFDDIYNYFYDNKDYFTQKTDFENYEEMLKYFGNTLDNFNKKISDSDDAFPMQTSFDLFGPEDF